MKLVKALYKKFSPSDKMKRGGKHKVMLTGDAATALGKDSYTSVILDDLPQEDLDKLAKLFKITIAEQLLGANEELTVDGFVEELKKLYLKQFPKAWIHGGYSKNLGENISIVLGIQPKSKWNNGIEQNDPARQGFHVFDGLKDGKFAEKITIKSGSSGTSLRVKPPEGKNLAYDRVKFGFRKKTGTPEQVLKHMDNYFKKMRKIVDDNKDNMKHDIS